MEPVGAAVTVLGLTAGLLLMGRVRGLPEAGGGPAIRVSVVVPARDEARNLPRLLRSLAAQTRAPGQVLVVDDGSTDDTAGVARAHGATVCAAPPPPSGWLGKPWACHVGMAEVSGDLVVLLDADTWLAPDALDRLTAEHHRSAPDGLLSVQPYHEVQRPYEHLSALGNLVPVMASGLAAVRPVRTSALAFGPCLVATPGALAAVGGFASVADEIVEDVALAAAFQRAGRPVVCRAGRSTVAFRMYPEGLRSLVEGWTKNLALGARQAPALPLVGAVLWVAAGLAVTAGLVLQPAPAALVAYGAYAGLLWWMLRRLGSFHPAASLAHPILVLAFVGLFTRSAVRHLRGRPVRWRGRSVRAPHRTARP